MEQNKVNPWTWQDKFGYSQGIEVVGGERTLYCAGQTSNGPDGEALHAGDMGAQCRQSFANLEAVLKQAGMTMANIVRINYYVTNIDQFFTDAVEIANECLVDAGQPASTLLAVSALHGPDLLIEIEATAVA